MSKIYAKTDKLKHLSQGRNDISGCDVSSQFWTWTKIYWQQDQHETRNDKNSLKRFAQKNMSEEFQQARCQRRAVSLGMKNLTEPVLHKVQRQLHCWNFLNPHENLIRRPLALKWKWSSIMIATAKKWPFMIDDWRKRRMQESRVTSSSSITGEGKKIPMNQ